MQERIYPAAPTGRLWPRNDGEGVAPGRVWPPFHIPEQGGPITVHAIYPVYYAGESVVHADWEVVGQPPWGDDDDGSYADVHSDYGISGFGVARINATASDLPALSVATAHDQIALSFQVRIQAQEPDLAWPGLSLQRTPVFRTDPATTLLAGQAPGGTVPIETTWANYPLPGPAEQIDAAFDALAADQGARIYCLTPYLHTYGDFAWRIFEVSLVATIV